MGYTEQRRSGVIKRIVVARGFGFLAVPDAREEFFFHQSAVVDARFETLREGQAVTFVATKGAKGPRAEAVSPA